MVYWILRYQSGRHLRYAKLGAAGPPLSSAVEGSSAGTCIRKKVMGAGPRTRSGRSFASLLLDPVAQVGDSGCGHSLDQAQSDVGGQFLEEAAAVAEEHGNLMKDHLVEQPGTQRGRSDAAAHDRDVPAARDGAGALDAGFDGRNEGLLVRRPGWCRAVA